MARRKLGTVKLENATITWRNFSGEEGQFNRKWDRNFCVLVNDEEAKTLQEEGWNVKFTKPKDPEDQPQPYLQVKANYGDPASPNDHPPIIWMHNSHGKALMDVNTIQKLDTADITNVDLEISPYQWEVNGKTGISAYVKLMHVTIAEDPWEAKYSQDEGAPDSAMNTIEFKRIAPVVEGAVLKGTEE
jgi:hypothetical protein